MNASQDERSRPTGNGPATESLNDGSTSIDARTAYVLLVETTNGHHRRRVLLSVAAAENAVERARRRGMTARVTLCRLVPVPGDA